MRLVVPVALDGDRVILAQDGVRGHTYTCSVCGAEVRYRGGHGTHRIPHFYHVRSTNCPGGETALHAAAKHVLLDALNDPLRRRSLLLLEKPAACERPESHPEVRRPLPARVTGARDEVAYHGRRIDVGLLDDAAALIAAVEIHVTHPVDDAK